MCIQSIKFTLPCSSSNQEKQTKCSLITRTTAIGLGVIALLGGVLILRGIPGIHSLGTAAGWSFVTAGSLAFLAGTCVKRVNGKNEKMSDYFSNITPDNYEQYIDVKGRYHQKMGCFIFTKKVYSEDCTLKPYYDKKAQALREGLSHKKGGIYLEGCVQFVAQGWFSGVSLDISNGEFVHYPQMGAPSVSFSNLKDFFDYLFRGDFYQGDSTKNMEFFILRSVTGEEMYYYNPYKH